MMKLQWAQNGLKIVRQGLKSDSEWATFARDSVRALRRGSSAIAAVVVASICLAYGLPGQDRVDHVGFRMLEFPFQPKFDIDGKPALPAINPEHFSSPSLTVQLAAVQATIAHVVAGSEVSQEIRAEILRLIDLEQADSIRQSAISAAVHLGLKETAPKLLVIASNDSVLAMQIEKALADWKYEPAASHWRGRLSGPSGVDAQLSAVRGLLSLGQATDVPLLESVLTQSNHAPVRLAAARALAELNPNGCEPLAKQRLQLANQSNADPYSLEAACLLLNASSIDALQMVYELAESQNDATAAEAFSMLAKNAFGQQSDLIQLGLKHTNPNVRRTCLQFIGSSRPTAGLESLADGMADPILANRELATKLMAEAWNEESNRDQIRLQIERMLASEAWQGREQAILLVNAIGHRQSIPRLFELAQDPSRDVYVTAAWCLRKLVTEPDDLAKALELATQCTDDTKMVDRPVPTTVDDYHRIGHLVELLGEQKSEAGSELMKRFIPKNSGFHTVARATAIWSLGSIYEGRPDAECRAAIEERMMDFRAMNPENIFVRYVATIAIGRIADETAIAQLERIPEPSITPVGQARDWAIKAIRERTANQ
jgi:HEAT repeat protein